MRTSLAVFLALVASSVACPVRAALLSDHVSFAADANGDPVAIVSNAYGSCTVALRGGYVLACAFAGDAHPLVYVPKTGYRRVSPDAFVHGGIPLLWPWFGSMGAPSPEAPFHATARSALFALESVEDSADATALVLSLGPCADVSAWTPGDFALEYRVALGDHRLSLRTTTTNCGRGEFRFRGGYHPYFAVSDCYAVTLSGVDGCVYESTRDLPQDVTHVWKGKVPEWPGCDQFRFAEPKSVVTLEDSAWARDIVLSTTGARDVVTWCQDVKGTRGGKAMNIQPEECRDYFCVEPSNFYDASEVVLRPGESHALETVISVVNRKNEQKGR